MTARFLHSACFGFVLHTRRAIAHSKVIWAKLIGAKLIWGAPLLLLVGTSHAYLPPSGYLVRKVAQKHQLASTLQVQSILSAVDSSGAVIFRAKKVDRFTPSTGVGSSSISSETHGELATSQWTIRGSGNHWSDLAQIQFQADPRILEAFLVARKVPVLTAAQLAELPTEAGKYDAEQMRLERIGRNPAWVIGKRNSEGSELWIDKGTQVPVRWTSRQPGQSYSATLSQVRSLREFPLARHLEVIPLPPESSFSVYSLVRVNRFIEEVTDVQSLAKPGSPASGASGGVVSNLSSDVTEVKIAKFYLSLIY
jgi:hypothetical protein